MERRFFGFFFPLFAFAPGLGRNGQTRHSPYKKPKEGHACIVGPDYIYPIFIYFLSLVITHPRPPPYVSSSRSHKRPHVSTSTIVVRSLLYTVLYAVYVF